MGVNFSTLLYDPVYDMFAVAITVNPINSQPAAAPYDARGIYDTVDVDVIALDGSIVSDQKTIVDIREAEFPVLPLQGDHVIIPFDCNGAPLGEYEILDTDTNGGGETTLTLRKFEPPSLVDMKIVP
jgi:hypothetical protein